MKKEPPTELDAAIAKYNFHLAQLQYFTRVLPEVKAALDEELDKRIDRDRG